MVQESHDLPHVFTIPASAPFLPTLIEALMQDRLGLGFKPGADPLALASATVYLPTRRACRLAQKIFLDVLNSDAAILPRIVPIGDVDEDELAFAEAAIGDTAGATLDLPDPVSGLQRKVLLAQLILKWAASPEMRGDGNFSLVANSPTAALLLAGELARLMDDMVMRQVPWDRLDGLVPTDMDEYWQKTLRFLKIAREYWPAVLKEKGRIEPAERRDRLIAAEAKRLATGTGPVIAAGSTGSIPATATLLATIAKLPHGALVLPGLDTELDDGTWNIITGSDTEAVHGHPQFAMSALLARIGIVRDAVQVLGEPKPHGRERMASEALRPAAMSELWQERLANADFTGHADTAMESIAAIEAANAEEEALAVAVALREAEEVPGKTAALVTPDRALARRVLAALARWNVPVDDSGGDALSDTPAGVFARLAAEAALDGLPPVTLLALLKHPLCRLDAAAVSTLERAILRGPRPKRGTAGLAHALQTFRVEREKFHRKEPSSLHRSDPRTAISDTEFNTAVDLVAALKTALAPLESLPPGPHAFAEIAARHAEVVRALGGLTEELAAAFDEIADAGALAVEPGDYAELFHAATADRAVRRPEADVRVRIYGPLEARLQSVDRLVLGGLVEGVWPPQTRADPWLSRPMRHELGLDLPERRIGLSAHDFAQALGAPEVILTRAAKQGGAPTVASRFVQRLAAVAGEARWDAALQRGARYAALARKLDETATIKPAARPAPKPPLAARPKQLSVTEIEHWLRDPYTIYAKHVLKLAPLDEIDTAPGASDRGTLIHNSIGEFAKTYATKMPDDPVAAMKDIGERHFKPLADFPEARAFWWPRFLRIAEWLAGYETVRRAKLSALHAEIGGSIPIRFGDGEFKLTVRADRIECLSDGRYAILDYKTGAPPTEKQVRTGLSPQLTLEAAILRQGGFRAIPAGATVGELLYVRLRGGAVAGEAMPIEFEIGTVDEQADNALARLTALLAKFADPSAPYYSLLHPMWATHYGTYDHLARVQEWSLIGDDEDDEISPRVELESGSMSKPRTIPDAVIERQIAASNPNSSAWVAANAGSGKTHVLAQRVIRLLLAGVDPARILCITFTKAAAANMANRVFDTLRAWTVLDDVALDEAMRKTGARYIDAKQRRRARQLFALALETPGGLKVHTIHAFCTQLLHLFPFEANVAARFDVLDETTETRMLEQISLDVMLKAADTPDSPLGRALGQAVLAAADITFRDMVREVIRNRDKLTRWVDAAGGVPQAMAQLSQTLGVRLDETVQQVDAAIFSDSLIANSEWTAVGAALTGGSKNDKDQGAQFHALAALTGTDLLDTYLDIFCTSKREKTKERIATNAVQRSHPDLCQRLQAERDRVWALVQHKRAIETRDRSVALFTIAHAVIARFRAEKDRRGLLDYEDLIDKTLDLLNNVSAAWVHYKLDRGIHHVLIDEAQDTSPKQWAIVKALVSEFFSGQGAHDRPRTIFAVGDEKQSIFSFQGAAPREFDGMRKHFIDQHERAQLAFVSTEFKHSFRSGEIVLGAVDKVFFPPHAYAGLTADPVPPIHEALPEAAPGLVEIWDLAASDERNTIEPWDAPFDIQNVSSATVKLAKRIAGSVAAWRRQGRLAKDVLILVRRRGALFESIIRALKNEGIPVAGADRLVLTEHIAVMDLMVLADALLLPEDDLALATVLKSPLFGLDDDDLFKLAWDRKGSLRSSLRAQRPDLAARLDAMSEKARALTPFAFYADLLGAGGGRKQILGRLGHEANDALDEFLNLALDYERAETPSLQGFIAWMRAARSEVKRDMEMARDEVRVMTVHGAKGLEAPIVILADTTTPPQGWHPPKLLSLPTDKAVPNTPARLIWATAKANDVGPMGAARETALGEARDEYRRLLYVAMTRAIERLVVCGVEGKNKPPEGCWYELVVGALKEHCATEQADDGMGKVLRYRKTPDTAAGAASSGTPVPAIAIPGWLNTLADTAPVRDAPIKPSGFVDDPGAREQPGARDARRRAILRGNIVHRLMQSLPDIPNDARADAARRHIERQNTDFSEPERAAIVDGVVAMLGDPQFAALFAPGSRAEVPIVGRINGRTVAGVVDRLVVAPDMVLIADYKTNRPAPRSLAETQQHYQGYIVQLSLYRAVLARLYPTRHIRAALVWTDVPALDEIPAEALDAALVALTTP